MENEEIIKEIITFIDGDYQVTILPSGARIEQRISDEPIIEEEIIEEEVLEGGENNDTV
jgi:hypothetical protein